MIKKIFISCFILTFLSAISLQSFAQEKKTTASKNLIKTNLTGIAFKNYSLQYERIINRKFSVALQYRIMPSSSIPLQKLILKHVGDDDPDTKKIIEDLRISNYAFTPEARFYVGKKGYGRGFYIAAFYRYASFTSNDLTIFYTDENNNQSSIKLSGKLTANTGGILFGVQHFFGKRIVLDVWLLGPHYGSGVGNFNGIPSSPLNTDEQNALRDQLNSMDIPLTHKTVEVNANSATLKLNGPWGGVRSGISLGIKF